METPMDIMESGVTTLPIKEREPLMHSGSCICVKNKRIAIKDETTPADKSCCGLNENVVSPSFDNR